ncbi:MAG: hypothetical protein V3W09_02435 [Nitrososphaerales archaeon]
MEIPSPQSDPAGAVFSDERKRGEWKTRYEEREAKRAILLEAIYLAVLLLVCPLFLILIWLIKCDHIKVTVPPGQCPVFCRYAYAWLGGLYGGTVYTAKWLYHGVAHGLWNIDRRLWRFLSPLLSAALAIAFIWMIDSELVSIFEGESVQKTPVVLSCAFLVGYFSDRAAVKMGHIAIALFGVSKDNSHSPKDQEAGSAK